VMRARTMILCGALLLASAGPARAQQGQASESDQWAPAAPARPGVPSLGRIDFGVRGTDVEGDRARYNRFRDRRDGVFLDAFRFEKENGTTIFRAEADGVGYRDQRFFGAFERIGRLKASFEWDQIPLFIHRDTRTLYSGIGTGVLTIDDAIQQGIQSGATTLANVIGGARQFEIRSRRDIGAFDLTYSANRDVDLKLSVTNTRRSGSNLMSFGLGSNAGNMTTLEMAAPLDDRTTQVKTAVEFANARGLLSAGVDGSWYNNSAPTLRFDNPLRATDIVNGSSQGQGVLWPTNSAISFNVNGAYRLPARSRASAAISIGRVRQDEPLVTPSVNTALVTPPLPRTTADAQANVLSMVYGFTSRAVNDLWLNARYRYYDYDNRTAPFVSTAVVGDWSVGTARIENQRPSLSRRTLDLDASFTPEQLRYVAFNAGFTRQDVDRTFRIFESTAENTVRVSVDSVGSGLVTVRTIYERSSREGSGFDPRILEEAHEQPGMRHFDVASRDRDRVTATIQVMPAAQVGFNASIGAGKDDYKESFFGLRDNRHNVYSLGVDFVPVDVVAFNASYSRERYEALLWSRTAAPGVQFDDPTRDWFLDQTDRVHTVALGVDLLRALPRTDIRLGYDLTDGTATYVHGLPPNTTLAPPRVLPPLTSRLTMGRADVQYFLRQNVAFGVAYWYENYDVFDFSMNPATINQLNLPAAIYAGYLYRPYTAHTGWVRMRYLW
jgi:MtrB/PioB family decaheme-associated outer membrane protein